MNPRRKPNTEQGLGRREFLSKTFAAGILTSTGIKLGVADMEGENAAGEATEQKETQATVGNENSPLTLWYNQPASFRRMPNNERGVYRSILPEALFIGNGGLGAMIQGGVGSELLRLNEHTLWTGGLNPSRNLLENFGSYQTLGDLFINLSGQHQARSYRRSLDLNRALSELRYSANGINYQREYFASYPDGVIVIRLTANRPGSYSGSISFGDGHGRLADVNRNRLTIPGSLENGMRYETQILVLNEGGSQKPSVEDLNGRIDFSNCDSLTILVAAATDYAMNAGTFFRTNEDPHAEVTARLAKASGQAYDALKERHIADYRSIFSRFEISLGNSSEAQRALPTDLRLTQAGKECDPEFEQLACQYGRYLMISCSRPGSVPANGQGMWNDSNSPFFRCMYTTDIASTELSYWGVEPSNLGECHLPLLNLIQSLIPIWRRETQASAELKLPSGEMTTRGWEIPANHNTMGGGYAWWNKGGNAWYCNLFWEHFAFGNDRQYLKEVVYPLLKETCEYWEDHLKTLPDGRLIVTDIQYSPEHGPFHVDGCSYCQELVWDVFTNYLDACDILNVDRDYQKKIAGMREKLLKPGVGSWGQLLEWMKDMTGHVSTEPHEFEIDAFDNGPIDTPQNRHRHCSHLLGVFPLRQISYEQTPELAAAAKVSAIARGLGENRGFHILSFGHRIPVYARLYDGERAHDLIQRAFTKMEGTNLSFSGGETSMALSHPTGFCELLVQSHQKDIHVLPALPKAWPTGQVKGVRARGGYEVDESWKEGKLASLTIRSIAGNAVNVRYGAKRVKVDIHPGESVTLDGDLQVKGKIASQA
jgi:alpha-L-fucosidase 2